MPAIRPRSLAVGSWYPDREKISRKFKAEPGNARHLKHFLQHIPQYRPAAATQFALWLALNRPLIGPCRHVAMGAVWRFKGRSSCGMSALGPRVPSDERRDP